MKKGMMSTLRSKIGALLVKPALKGVLKDFDTSEYGGAPLLGLERTCCQDTWKLQSQRKYVIQLFSVLTFKEQKINEKIKEAIQQETLEEKKEDRIRQKEYYNDRI